ncbi:type II secretion system F family protein [Paenibacillus sp. NEAU-GSW1]|uniref:type II secretion system F family protein n=1 Tax=Paenibacillus sp. NEAU-GSW1 TaxID=2682486 RepID=UPI0012E152C4|nr:type II secretion system F family protein [Paenibacillus sp. NEAU-GSW1]MUT68065.1 pilus assembly protein TadB [Paenibacillus sp. NEAU-GSW1]
MKGNAARRSRKSSSNGVRQPQSGRFEALLQWLGWPSDVRGSGNESPSLPRYDDFRLSYQQFIAAACIGCAIAFLAAYLVYHSFVLSMLLAVTGLCAPRMYRAAQLQRRRDRLKLQFKEALYSLASSLAAGRSVENAFIAAIEDLKLMYPDPRTELLQEFIIVRHRLDHAEPLEHALRQFAERARIDDISGFADVFAACKRSGGDLVEVMKRSSQSIGEKLEVEQEIAVMVAQKRFEARIMMAVPFVFLAFLSFAAPDYMAPLYSGAGYLLLTAGLAVLLLCFWFIQKIMSIQV